MNKLRREVTFVPDRLKVKVGEVEFIQDSRASRSVIIRINGRELKGAYSFSLKASARALTQITIGFYPHDVRLLDEEKKEGPQS